MLSGCIKPMQQMKLPISTPFGTPVLANATRLGTQTRSFKLARPVLGANDFAHRMSGRRDNPLTAFQQHFTTAKIGRIIPGRSSEAENGQDTQSMR